MNYKKKGQLGTSLSCFSRVNSRKKGISAIVATVLIILITVAAVTIIWAAIIPMINQQITGSQQCMDAISQVSLKTSGYTCRVKDACYNTTSKTFNSDNKAACIGNEKKWIENQTSIQIGHGAKDLDLVDVQVLMSSGGDTTSKYLIGDAGFAYMNQDMTEAAEHTETDSDLPGANEEKVFYINTTSVGGVVEKIEIAPVVGVGATQDVCEGTTEVTLMDC